MATPPLDNGPVQDPIRALAEAREGGVLAVIIGVEGPSYRPLGATMAILASGARVGTLSSGCIESDIALHAQEALARGETRRLRYGQGSPFVDIRLPCGGGLEILLVPHPDQRVLADLSARQAERRPVTLVITPQSGALLLREDGETAMTGGAFSLRFLPEIKFFIFGKGPEASTFAGLVQSSGYPNILLSPDEETLDFGRGAGCRTHHLTRADWPSDVRPDAWSAVVLFFHDHEWEPPILQGALDTPAFYIGAQGSKRARDLRFHELELRGVRAEGLARLIGPIGLVPSARDARTLAVSVLAEVLARAMR